MDNDTPPVLPDQGENAPLGMSKERALEESRRLRDAVARLIGTQSSTDDPSSTPDADAESGLPVTP